MATLPTNRTTGNTREEHVSDHNEAHTGHNLTETHRGQTTAAHGGIVASTDARLSDARTPTAHRATHAVGGTDALTTADLASGTANNTTFLRGDRTWAAPGGGGGGALIVISRTVLTAAAASIDLTAIPGTYENLRLVLQLRTDVASTRHNVDLRFNGDTAANYSSEFVTGNSNVVTSGAAGSGRLGTVVGASGTAGAASMHDVVLAAYARTTFHKQWLARTVAIATSGGAEFELTQVGGTWASTVAISQVTILPSTGNFVAGSTVTLYGEAGS